MYCTNPAFGCQILINFLSWLPVRYVRVYAIANPSVVCLSVTFVHPIHTQLVEIFGNVYTPICTLAIRWPPCKIYGDYILGNPPSGVKRKRGSNVGHLEGYITGKVQDLVIVIGYNYWLIGNHTRKIQCYYPGSSKVTHNKGFGPQVWETVYIFEVNEATKVKSDAQIAINKNSDPMKKLFP